VALSAEPTALESAMISPPVAAVALTISPEPVVLAAEPAPATIPFTAEPVPVPPEPVAFTAEPPSNASELASANNLTVPEEAVPEAYLAESDSTAPETPAPPVAAEQIPVPEPTPGLPEPTTEIAENEALPDSHELAAAESTVADPPSGLSQPEAPIAVAAIPTAAPDPDADTLSLTHEPAAPLAFEPGQEPELETANAEVEASTPSAEREPVSSLDMGPLAISAIAPPTQPSFATDFHLSMDSLDPDLPDDLPGENELPAMDPASVEQPLDEGPPVAAAPTFDDAPVLPEPVSFTAVSMVDDSHMILTAPEPEQSAAVSPAPDVAPPAETSIEQPTYSSAEVEVPQSLSPARKAFYENHAEALSSLTTTLARTRGVTSIYLVAREGVTIDSVAKDEISEKRVGDLVRESFEFLEAFANDPAYWVLECAGGIFVMQKLDDRHVLIAIGQAGANFGALRYTMDKTRTKFEQLLAQAPQ
jgi:predicted regulator of Ras-like GTPase activity (Roadblock/LC7/MglB family)